MTGPIISFLLFHSGSATRLLAVLHVKVPLSARRRLWCELEGMNVWRGFGLESGRGQRCRLFWPEAIADAAGKQNAEARYERGELERASF